MHDFCVCTVPVERLDFDDGEGGVWLPWPGFVAPDLADLIVFLGISGAGCQQPGKAEGEQQVKNP
ncbi:MAG: hypothetical protein N2C13_02505 [Chloroflexota bacterium]